MLFWFCLLVYCAAAITFVVWGEGRFRAHDRLPMQWSGKLAPTWALSRRWALIVCAALGGSGFLAVLPIFIPLMLKGHTLALVGGLGLFFMVVGLGAIALYAALLLRWDQRLRAGD